MEDADGTNINTNPLVYTCEVGTRLEEGIKKEKETLERGRMKICN